jgi:hypothetical protein
MWSLNFNQKEHSSKKQGGRGLFYTLYFIGIFPAQTSWFIGEQNRGHMFSDSDSDSQFVEIWFRQEIYRCHFKRTDQTGISLSSLILDELSWLNLRTMLDADICFWALLPVSWDLNEISSRRVLNDFPQISSFWSSQKVETVKYIEVIWFRIGSKLWRWKDILKRKEQEWNGMEWNEMTPNVWPDMVRLQNFEKIQLKMRCTIQNIRTIQKTVKFEKPSTRWWDRAMRSTEKWMNFLRIGDGSGEISDCSSSAIYRMRKPHHEYHLLQISDLTPNFGSENAPHNKVSLKYPGSRR